MYFKLKTRLIKNKNNKNITEKKMINVLKYVAKNHPFSTFPYIKNKKNSKNSLKKNKSGNCIALTIAGKQYLKNKYNINSYIIPASIPKIFSNEKYLHICHVALYVPKNKYLGYILDFAFYFTKPIFFNLKNKNKNNIVQCKMMNIYNRIEENLSCYVDSLKIKTFFNKYQTLPKNTKYIKTFYTNKPDDSWNYYLREIINPDKSITTFYINIKNKPFLCVLDDNYGFKLHIKFLDENTFFIKKYGKIIFQGTINEIPLKIMNIISPIVNSFFNFNIPKFLSKININEIFYFKDFKKTKKNIYIKPNKKTLKKH